MPSFPDRDPSPRRKVLIFEPDIEGHSLEWLDHLVTFAAAGNGDTEVWVAAPEELCRSLAQVTSSRVHFAPLTPLQRRLCTSRRLSLAALARWWTMRRHLEQSGVDQGFFLTLDLLSLPLALGLGVGGRKLSGILFRPSVHYGEIGPYDPSWRERLRDMRKGLLYRLMLSNPAVDRVLSLDPFFPLHAHTHYRRGEKVQALPDPAHPSTAAVNGEDGGDFVPTGRVGFLLFGYLAERKGPLAVLEALALLPTEIARRTAVLFAGRVDPLLRDRLERQQQELAALQPDLWFRIDDRRLDRAELAALVRRSDVVLAPYQRFVGSSGVLLWAALNGRPVLAQDFGLVGRLTREHRLGISVDSSDPEQIANQIMRMVECGPQTFIDRPAAERFAAAQTPHRFASAVLSV